MTVPNEHTEGLESHRGGYGTGHLDGRPPGKDTADSSTMENPS